MLSNLKQQKQGRGSRQPELKRYCCPVCFTLAVFFLGSEGSLDKVVQVGGLVYWFSGLTRLHLKFALEIFEIFKTVSKS